MASKSSEQKFKIELHLLNGETHEFELSKRYTVDKVKDTIFDRVRSLTGASKLDYQLGLSRESKITVEFVKFAECHEDVRKIFEAAKEAGIQPLVVLWLFPRSSKTMYRQASVASVQNFRNRTLNHKKLGSLVGARVLASSSSMQTSEGDKEKLPDPVRADIAKVREEVLGIKTPNFPEIVTTPSSSSAVKVTRVSAASLFTESSPVLPDYDASLAPQSDTSTPSTLAVSASAPGLPDTARSLPDDPITEPTQPASPPPPYETQSTGATNQANSLAGSLDSQMLSARSPPGSDPQLQEIDYNEEEDSDEPPGEGRTREYRSFSLGAAEHAHDTHGRKKDKSIISTAKTPSRTRSGSVMESTSPRSLDALDPIAEEQSSDGSTGAKVMKKKKSTKKLKEKLKEKEEEAESDKQRKAKLILGIDDKGADKKDKHKEKEKAKEKEKEKAKEKHKKEDKAKKAKLEKQNSGTTVSLPVAIPEQAPVPKRKLSDNLVSPTKSPREPKFPPVAGDSSIAEPPTQPSVTTSEEIGTISPVTTPRRRIRISGQYDPVDPAAIVSPGAQEKHNQSAHQQSGSSQAHSPQQYNPMQGHSPLAHSAGPLAHSAGPIPMSRDSSNSSMQSGRSRGSSFNAGPMAKDPSFERLARVSGDMSPSQRMKVDRRMASKSTSLTPPSSSVLSRSFDTPTRTQVRNAPIHASSSSPNEDNPLNAEGFEGDGDVDSEGQSPGHPRLRLSDDDIYSTTLRRPSHYAINNQPSGRARANSLLVAQVFNGNRTPMVQPQLAPGLRPSYADMRSGSFSIERNQLSRANLAISELPEITSDSLQRKRSARFPSLRSSPPLMRTCKGFWVEVGRDALTPELLLSEGTFAIENAADDNLWYAECFAANPHSNYIGVDSTGEPFVLSVIRPAGGNMMRALLRSKRGDDRQVFIESKQTAKIFKSKIPVQEVLRLIAPSLSGVKIRPVKDLNLIYDLMAFEERLRVKTYKFGVLLCKEGQTKEEEMFSNEYGSEMYDDFLKMVGETVKLKGFDKFKGGLDVERDTTGTHSVYTQFEGNEIMFHVSTMLPFSMDNPQQLERKRHLGNDMVVLVFKEGNTPYFPNTISSEFIHVVGIVQPELSGDAVRYRFSIASKDGVPPFSPALPTQGLFEPGVAFRNLLLTKLINGERAAYKAPAFVGKFQRTRSIMLKELENRFK